MYSKIKVTTLKMYSRVRNTLSSIITKSFNIKNPSNKNSNVVYVSKLYFLISIELCSTEIPQTTNNAKKPFYLVKGFPKGFINITASLQAFHVTFMFLYSIKTLIFSSAK